MDIKENLVKDLELYKNNFNLIESVANLKFEEGVWDVFWIVLQICTGYFFKFEVISVNLFKYYFWSGIILRQLVTDS